jgi:putative flavoprotein involved in K+ transport
VWRFERKLAHSKRDTVRFRNTLQSRNMWKPTQQEALWFHGGNLHQSRHYSLCLALQLKARTEGIDTPVDGLQEVHHTC